MLLWLAEQLQRTGGAASQAALEKITLRAALAALAAFLLTLLCGPPVIGWLARHFREPIKSASPRVAQLHAAKHGTPTLGGLLVFLALAGAVLLAGDLSSRPTCCALAVAGGFLLLGLADDVWKLCSASRGLSPRAKLLGQTLLALAAAWLLWSDPARASQPAVLWLPVANVGVELGRWWIPWAALVMVATSNAVNLTDGLDGLAGGCLLWAAGAVGVLAYLAGHAGWSAYLGMPHTAGAGELTVLMAGLIGALLGFLWFNCHPAQVFMGNTGALPLGALLGWTALAAGQELLLIVLGGVFVVEALSVLLQVALFRATGRRLFRCAPLHHHFQFAGWPESKIVVRFWIAALLCAVGGLALLKFSVHEMPPISEETRTAANFAAAPDSHRESSSRVIR